MDRAVGSGMLRTVAARTAAALGVVAVLCFGGAAWLIQSKAAQEQEATALRELEQLARSEAAQVRGSVTESLVMVRGLAAATMQLIEGGRPDRAAASELVRRYAAADPAALGYWLEFEPGAFDGRDATLRRSWPGGTPDARAAAAAMAAMSPGERVTTDTGRLSIYWVLDDAGKPRLERAVGPDMDKNLDEQDYYVAARTRGAEMMYEPYTYEVAGKDVLMTSVQMPLVRDGRHLGVAGADITLGRIQSDLARVRPYGTGVVRLLSPKGLVLAAPEAALLGKPWPQPLDAVRAQLAAGRSVHAEEFDPAIGSRVYRVYAPVTAGRGEDVFVLVVSAPVETVMAGVREVRNRVLAVGLVSVGLLVALVVVLLRRRVGAPLERIVRAVDAVAAGELDHPIAEGGTDEVGHVSRALRRMQVDLKQRIEAERRIAAENLRVRIALDNAGTAMLIAGGDGCIAYANPAMRALLDQHSVALRRALPDLDADRLEGQPLARLQPADAPAADAVAHVRQCELGFGDVVIAQTLAPVTSPEGMRLGVVVEWRDRTQEVAVEAEVAEVIEAAAAGNLGKRIGVANKTGFFRRLAQGVDSMLDANEQSINAVQRVLAALAEGDLTQRIDGHAAGVFGRMRDDTNTTVQRLAEIMHRLQLSADTISTAAAEIAAGNQDLSQRSEKQSASLQATAEAMGELTTAVAQNAEASRKARELSIGAVAVAGRGGEVMGDVVTRMHGISSDSRRIASIIGVIDEIAFQTNILALNAGVEATRAGEHGRGFAVVATEVRSLAQRSAKAAREIKGLIAQSGERVESGAALVAQAGATMDEIVVAVRRVTDLMGEISAASDEQAAGIGEVNHRVADMDASTLQNVALVEQASAAAASLEDQATELAGAVAVFRLP